MSNVYDVTTFMSPSGTSPFTDIGKVINEIIADIHALRPPYHPPRSGHLHPARALHFADHRQHRRRLPDHQRFRPRLHVRGRPRRLTATGPGWRPCRAPATSRSQHQPGRLLRQPLADPAANGRLDGIVFQDFCIDGMTDTKPYLPGNGKTGIQVRTTRDSLRIEGMGFVYLAHAISVATQTRSTSPTTSSPSAATASRSSTRSIVGKITNNYLISPWAGFSIFIENNDGVSSAATASSGRPESSSRRSARLNITGNKFVSSFSGMIVHETQSDENLISSTSSAAIFGDGGPARNDDLYGMVQLNGNGNSVTSKLLSFNMPPANLNPPGATPTMILVKGGDSNFLASNQVRANLGVEDRP